MNEQATFTRRNTLLAASTVAITPALATDLPVGIALSPANAQTASAEFPGGFPTPQTAQKLYDDADLNRAIQTYKFFYPNISMAGLAILSGSPKQILFTPNSDTPYAALPLDLRAGPIAVELPAGPLIGVANDWNFRWVMDMGVPGPDVGKGGKHILLPPDWKGEVPAGYYTGQSTTYRVFLIIRSLPVGGDMKGAIERIKTVKVHPLNPPAGWAETWTDVSDRSFDATPITWEKTLKFWEVLHQIIETEPP